jgi:nucleotide-binding universal stress UspA family protein
LATEDDEEESEKRRVSPEKLARHLRLYGIAAEPKRLIADIEVAAQLLSRVADESADFLVMGDYGHSRLREMVLGGTTLEILRSMTAPVLMAH